jgi:plasmid maintenance system antidote protein VapI
MDLSELIEKYGGQAQFAEAVGLDRFQLNRVVKNRRPMGPKMAVQIFNVTGHKLGPLAETARAA